MPLIKSKTTSYGETTVHAFASAFEGNVYISVKSTEGDDDGHSYGVGDLTPAEARTLASILLQEAELAERLAA